MTVTSTATTTIDYTPPPSKARRAPDVTARHVPYPLSSSCRTPTTQKAWRIPLYAINCWEPPGAYSSACSCLGATPSTLTLPVPTVSDVTTVTLTTTPTATALATTTVGGGTVINTVLTTTVVPTTVTSSVTTTQTATTTITVTITSTTTAVTTTTSDTTVATTTSTDVVTATTTACPIVQLAGPLVGQYLTDDPSNSDLLMFTSSISQALDFSVDANGLLNSNGLFVLTLPSVSSFVPLQGTYQPGDDGTVEIACVVNPDSTLTCHCSGSNNLFLSEGNSYLIFGEASDITAFGYTNLTLALQCPSSSSK